MSKSNEAQEFDMLAGPLVRSLSIQAYANSDRSREQLLAKAVKLVHKRIDLSEALRIRDPEVIATLNRIAEKITDTVWQAKVGSKKPNPWGLHDMHGSVMEWVIDGHDDKGFASIATKPSPVPFANAIIWPKELSNRVVRGGGWTNTARACRSAVRFRLPPDQSSYNVGFRVVLVAGQ